MRVQQTPEHVAFGLTQCGDLIRAFKIIKNELLVGDKNLLDYESIIATYDQYVLPITVKITDDGHGTCDGLIGGPMMSETATFQVTINDINERPTYVQLQCTMDMVLMGPYNGCVKVAPLN